MPPSEQAAAGSVPDDPLSITGVSVAGMETCLTVPPFRLALDMGRCTPSSVNMPVVAVSHGHLDHCGALALHAGRRALLGMPPARYLVPAQLEDGVQALFNAHSALDHSALPRVLVPVRPGDSVALGKGRTLRVFETIHRVTSVGFSVCSRKSRLLPELASLDAQEIARLHRSGAVVTQELEQVELAFTSDTLPEVIEREPAVRDARVLVMECTFLDDSVTVQHARAMGHVHLQELLPRLPMLRNEVIYLTHFSARYDRARAQELLHQHLPESMHPRVRLLPPAAA